jgi:hypothetical protein
MSADAASTAAPRRFRWLQFSLRTLLLVILVAALGLGWYSRFLRRQWEQQRQERIEKAIELLAAAPSIYAKDCDPMALVRAVNALHSLGKEDALLAIRRFESRYPSQSEPDSPHFSPTLIVPLLFEPPNPQEKYPRSPGLCAVAAICLCVQRDIPFRPYSSAGVDPYYNGARADLINWAVERGRLRARPLRPADDPLQAVDQAIETMKARLRKTHPRSDYRPQLLREQGLRCVAHLLQSDDTLPDLRSLSDAEWALLQDECKQLGVRWSEEQQQYVATKGAP